MPLQDVVDMAIAVSAAVTLTAAVVMLGLAGGLISVLGISLCFGATYLAASRSMITTEPMDYNPTMRAAEQAAEQATQQAAQQAAERAAEEALRWQSEIVGFYVQQEAGAHV